MSLKNKTIEELETVIALLQADVSIDADMLDCIDSVLLLVMCDIRKMKTLHKLQYLESKEKNENDNN